MTEWVNDVILSAAGASGHMSLEAIELEAMRVQK